MTTYAPTSIVCGNCRQVFTHHVLASTNTFGSPDLDTRPAQMQRSTMHAWVQRCPGCGYCSPDVTRFEDQFRAVIENAAYRSQLADANYPELASTFVCAGMIADASGARDDAGWNYLRAAWTLDDADKVELARLCRSEAADRFLALLKEEKSFAQQLGAAEAIVTDCLRRADRMDEAIQIIERASSQSYGEIIDKILAFQQVLVERGDTARHLIEEAIKAD